MIHLFKTICFIVILAKYGMDGKKDNRALDSNNLKDHDSKLGEIFEDPRLDKLWNKVRHDQLKLTST